ncbi:MAG: hypothetical protein JST92_24285, partial [Deltaproteobacteria bacterium]|nr:hypothetical protein [Deltaproteobacteria bacterium]
MGRWIVLVALVVLAPWACTKTAPALGGIGDACLLNGDCAAGFVCTASRCALPSNLGGCEPGNKRCSGNDIEQCSADGLSYERVDTCATGCTAGACRAQTCTPGAQECEGDAALECSPAGDAWVLVQICATHCNPDTGRCKSPACAPFTARCDPSGNPNVQICDAYGSGYVTTACAQGEVCANGACQTNNANCQLGDLRCNGPDVQKCASGGPGITTWAPQGTCLAGCSGGACNPGGSCTNLTLHTASASVPMDGVSSVLVYSDPVVGLDAQPLPDGQLFTITVSSSGGQPTLLSPDADATRAGAQVRSSGGRVHFAVQAPTATGVNDALGSFTAALAQGGSCAASTNVTFSAASSTGVLIAEEFRNAAVRNVAATTADWNVSLGAVVASPPIDTGTGLDGPLTVASNTTVDLSAAGGTQLMPAFVATSVSGANITVAGNAAGLAGGDEVLVWDAQGLSGQSVNAGNYETARVLAVSGGTITLTQPLRGTYGVGGDQNVSAQHVVVQRVPQLSTLTVAPSGTLTAKAWDGSTGGVLFLRVHGGAHVEGVITMDGRGFRGAASAGAGEDLSGRPGVGGASGSGAGGTACGGGHGTAGTCATGFTLTGA